MRALSQTSAAIDSQNQFLLQPLGWVASRLEKLTHNDPGLLTLLVRINRARMHLLGLGLSYMREEVSNKAASLLLTASEREILHTIIGYCPVGIHRALQKLPGKVISALS